MHTYAYDDRNLVKNGVPESTLNSAVRRATTGRNKQSYKFQGASAIVLPRANPLDIMGWLEQSPAIPCTRRGGGRLVHNGRCCFS